MSVGVSILGSTGSVGVNTLDVITRHPDHYRVIALTAYSNVELLLRQCLQFKPELAVLADPQSARSLSAELSSRQCPTEVMTGPEGLLAAVAHGDCSAVMAAIVGAAGLPPTLEAARLGRRILLANKESLVIAGQLFMQLARDNGSVVLPVDSEHNAIFQSLPPDRPGGLTAAGVERIILTASGGPFLDLPLEEMAHVTPERACKHPNWEMGRKISVDSATLMNKGLELIEARWLFDATPQQLEVVVHPQSIIHSLVSYRDGSVLAQLGTPDMRTPIAYALAWPQRIESGVERLKLQQLQDLSFRAPDLQRFPCLGLAFEALNDSPGAPVVLNAANEIAVESFLDGRIRFDQIASLVLRAMEQVEATEVESLAAILELDQESRSAARQVIRNMS